MTTTDEIQQEMFALIEKFKKSNKPVTTLLREHNLKEWRYYFWLNKYKESKKQSTSAGFTPITVAPIKTYSTSLEIHYPNGVRVSLTEIGDLSFLQSLIRLG